jgi:hypothetical protein
MCLPGRTVDAATVPGRRESCPGGKTSDCPVPSFYHAGKVGHNILIFFLLILLLPAVASGYSQNASPATTVPGSGNLTAGTPAITSQPSPTATLIGDVQYPYISTNTSAGTISRTYTFPFQRENVTITANVSTAVYDGAQDGVKYAVTQPGNPVNLIAPGYFNAFISDPRQDSFYAGLLQDFRSIRARDNLSDDEYLELMTVFVQNLPYDTKSGVLDSPPRFPVETFVDGTGNCEDKSILLAGLLSREGYDVVLFLFLPEHHIALGIRNSSYSFQDTGYAYIETTGTLLVSEVPSELVIPEKYGPTGGNGNVTVANVTPLVIRAGNGTTGYTSANQVAFILDAEKEIDARALGLQARMGNCPAKNASCNRTIEQEYDRYAILHNYIVTHKYDRAGLYQKIANLTRQTAAAPVSPAPVPSSKTATCPARHPGPVFPATCRFSLGCIREFIHTLLSGPVIALR